MNELKTDELFNKVNISFYSIKTILSSHDILDSTNKPLIMADYI